MKYKVQVYKDTSGDWVFYCSMHKEEILWTYSWLSAMEAALGHLCMVKH